MTSPERKFEVGNDYKMSVGRPCCLLLAAHLFASQTANGGGAAIDGWTTASVLTDAYCSDSIDVIGEGAYGVVWCVDFAPDSGGDHAEA